MVQIRLRLHKGIGLIDKIILGRTNHDTESIQTIDDIEKAF